VASERGNELACLAVPQFDRLVERGAGYEARVRRELDVVDELLVAGHALNALAVHLGVP